MRVEVRIYNIRSGQGHVQASRDAQSRFVHATHHDLDSCGPSHGVDLQSIADASDLHQFHVHHVGKAFTSEPKRITKRHQALVCHHGKVRPLCHSPQQIRLASRCRLFDQFQARGARLVDEVKRLFNAKTLIGVESQLDFVPDRFAHSHDPLDIGLDVQPTLQFKCLKPVAHPAIRLTDGLSFGENSDRDARSDTIAVPAQYLPQRHGSVLPEDIEKCHVHCGENRGLLAQKGLQLLDNRHETQRVAPSECWIDNRLNRNQYGINRLAGDHLVRRGTPVAHVGTVGDDPQENVVGHVDRFIGDLVRYLQRHRHTPGFDTNDLHRCTMNQGSPARRWREEDPRKEPQLPQANSNSEARNPKQIQNMKFK